MPELGEVEYNRRQWDAGLRQKVREVHSHAGKRVLQGIDAAELRRCLVGAVYTGSEARGKQMLFRFSDGNWLGLHLGMTGQLRTEGPGFTPAKHDHLVLVQPGRALVFRDPRQFGRIRFHRGLNEPHWWLRLPPAVTSAQFTQSRMELFLQRHGRLPLKAALLLQDGFPGIGNWMADEILWRSRLDPRVAAGQIQDGALRELWRQIRWVSRRALAIIGPSDSNLPSGWLFHERWSAKGVCPIHRTSLRRAAVGGRTTAWCERCQHAGDRSQGLRLRKTTTELAAARS